MYRHMLRTTQFKINELSFEVIGAAMEVHRALGPGLLESIYERCLVRELEIRGFDVKTQVAVPVFYKGEAVGQNLRLDILVEDILVVEVKAVEEVNAIFQAQLLSYLKLSNKPKGLLINFNTERIKDHLMSLVTPSFTTLPKE